MYYVMYNIYVGIDVYKHQDLNFKAPNFYRENEIKYCGNLEECLAFYKEYF